jgi:opacity protein-like surface antigen
MKGDGMDIWSGTRLVSLAVLIMSVLAMPLVSSAEWNADIYGGGAFTNNFSVSQASSLGVTITGDVKVDSSFTVGGRVGYWFERVPWLGMGLDVFYFEPNIPTQDITATATGFGGSITGPAEWRETSVSVVGIGFDVLRARMSLLKSKEFPRGRLQPYMTAGPALFLTKLKDTDAFAPPNQSQSDTSVGVKVGAGVAFQITKALALFAEYRFTHFTADATFQDSTPPPSQETVKATFDTNHVIAGISFRF